MIRQTFALVVLAAVVAPASAEPTARLEDHIKQLREQAHLVNAHAEFVFRESSPDRLALFRVRGVIDAYHRKLDKLESVVTDQSSAQPHRRRLKRLVDLLDRQVTIVQDQVESERDGLSRVSGYGQTANSVERRFDRFGSRPPGRYGVSSSSTSTEFLVRTVGRTASDPGVVAGYPIGPEDRLEVEAERLKVMTKRLATIVRY